MTVSPLERQDGRPCENAICLNVLVDTRSNKIYCSDQCRKQAWRHRKEDDTGFYWWDSPKLVGARGVAALEEDP